MITVTNAFKTAVTAGSRQLHVRLYDITEEEYITSDKIINIRIRAEGSLFHSYMRILEVELSESFDLLEKEVRPEIGVRLANNTIEYISYPNFIIKEEEQIETSRNYRIKGYDYMYKFMRNYQSLFNTPSTVYEALDSICDFVGVDLSNIGFLSDDIEIESDPYILENGSTLRGVLDDIAQVSLTTVFINNDNELELRALPSTTAFTLALSDLKRATYKEGVKAIDSVSIIEQPDGVFEFVGGYFYPPLMLEDGFKLLLEDGGALTVEGFEPLADFSQYEILNNALTFDTASTLVQTLFTELEGLAIPEADITSFGLFFLEIGDRIVLNKTNSATATTIITSLDISIGNGTNEEIKSKPFEGYRTPVKSGAGTITNSINRSSIAERNLQDGSVTDAKIRNLSADKITAGSIGVVAKVGGEQGLAGVFLDGENNRIIIKDEQGRIVVNLGKTL